VENIVENGTDSMAEFVDNVATLRTNSEGPFTDPQRILQEGVEDEGASEGVTDQAAARRAEAEKALERLLTDVGVDAVVPPNFFITRTLKHDARHVLPQGQTSTGSAYYISAEEVDNVLIRVDAVHEGQPISTQGSVKRKDGTRFVWGHVPPVIALRTLPDRDTVRTWPDFYISGPGRAVAELTDCGPVDSPHGYNLTDSCPLCDALDDEDAPEADVVDPRQKRAEQAIRMAFELAYAESRDATALFASDVTAKGAVRATQLHLRHIVEADMDQVVWDTAIGWADGSDSWVESLDVAEKVAVRYLREAATPSRNAVDRAVAAIQAKRAAQLLDTIESYRKAWTA
jgi:hypothetical protein